MPFLLLSNLCCKSQSILRVSALDFPHWHHSLFPTCICRAGEVQTVLFQRHFICTDNQFFFSLFWFKMRGLLTFKIGFFNLMFLSWDPWTAAWYFTFINGYIAVVLSQVSSLNILTLSWRRSLSFALQINELVSIW